MNSSVFKMCIKSTIFLCTFLLGFVSTQQAAGLLYSISNVSKTDTSVLCAHWNSSPSKVNVSAGIENDLPESADKFCTPMQSSFIVDNTLADRKPRVVQKKWITEIFAEAQSKFDMHAQVNAACKQDYELYKQNLRNQTIWAVRMMESSRWPRVGLFSGHTSHFGHWTTCLKAEESGIRGRYCVVRATFNFTLDTVDKVKPGLIDWPDENVSAWRVINVYETLRVRYPRLTFTWTICMPESCNALDLQTSVDTFVRPLFEIRGLSFTVNVDPLDCNVSPATPLPNGYYFATSIFSILIALVLSATIYELCTTGSEVQGKDFRQGILFKLFGCFSAIRSWKILTHHSSDVYAVLYFLKSICTVSVILGHTIYLYFFLSTMNAEVLEMKVYHSLSSMLLYPIILNGFLVISGFLTTFHFDFSETKITGISFLIKSTVIRWLRVIPALAIVLLYLILLMPYTDGGPNWSTRILSEAKYCSSYWWTNMLALNNVINDKGVCFLAGWYVAVDIQLSIIGTALLLILKSNRKLGFLFMALTFVYSLASTFVVIFWNKYNGCPIFVPKEVDQWDTFLRVYTAAYHRLGPYLIGCATALLTKWLIRRKMAISWMQNLAALFSLFLIGIGFQLYAFKFFEVGKPNNPFENAIFGALNGSLFSLPVAGFICVYFVSGLGILNAVFELKIFVLFGRLSYSVYIVGFLLQTYRAAAQKQVLYEFDLSEIFWNGIGDIIFSTLLAIPVFFISEGPGRSITQLLRRDSV